MFEFSGIWKFLTELKKTDLQQQHFPEGQKLQTKAQPDAKCLPQQLYHTKLSAKNQACKAEQVIPLDVTVVL